MAAHPSPPFNPWLWWQAYQDTWLATLDPLGMGQAQGQRRLRRLLDAALQESPLYARRAAGARCLADFEPIGKAELMREFDHWATDRRITLEAAMAAAASPDSIADAWLDRYVLWSSSGTSGEPALLVQDAASLAAFDAIDALRLRGLPAWQAPLGAWPSGLRHAYVGAIGGPYAGHVNLVRLKRLLPGGWAGQVHMLSVLEPLPVLAKQLQGLQPDGLITYPSCAVALAGLQARGELRLNLREVWLGGEQLSATHRAILKQAFSCAVRNAYGASEFYAMAFECSAGCLHLNSDWLVLEGVDAQDRPVPEGEFSHSTLLTNLANQTQPLIRYRLNDQIRFPGTLCRCGQALPVIEVRGRSDDVLVMPGRQGAPVSLLPLAIETVLEEAAGISQFQLVRLPGGGLELRLAQTGSAGHEAYAAGRRALLRYFEQLGMRAPNLMHGKCPPAAQAGSGKLRKVLDLQHP